MNAALVQVPDKLRSDNARRLIFSGACIRVEGEQFRNQQGVRISPRSRHTRTIVVLSALMAFGIKRWLTLAKIVPDLGCFVQGKDLLVFWIVDINEHKSSGRYPIAGVEGNRTGRV